VTALRAILMPVGKKPNRRRPNQCLAAPRSSTVRRGAKAEAILSAEAQANIIMNLYGITKAEDVVGYVLACASAVRSAARWID
jgi:hypothetical protein